MSEKVTVVGILDAGAFVGTTDDSRSVYGLYDFRAPEKWDDHYSEVKSALAELIEGKTVFVEQKATGHYGRPYVVVKTPEGKDVNAEMKNIASVYN